MFTGISFFILLLVSVWFASEQAVYGQYHGYKLLAEVIDDFYSDSKGVILWHFAWIAAWCRHQAAGILSRGLKTWEAMHRLWSTQITSTLEPQTYGDEGGLPLSHPIVRPVSSLQVPKEQLDGPSPASPTTHACAQPFLSHPDLEALEDTHSTVPPLPGHEHLSLDAMDTGVSQSLSLGGATKEPFTAVKQITSLDSLEMTEIIPVHPSGCPVLDLQFGPGRNLRIARKSYDETSIWLTVACQVCHIIRVV
jgi:hypothetical protein